MFEKNCFCLFWLFICLSKFHMCPNLRQSLQLRMQLTRGWWFGGLKLLPQLAVLGAFLLRNRSFPCLLLECPLNSRRLELCFGSILLLSVFFVKWTPHLCNKSFWLKIEQKNVNNIFFNWKKFLLAKSWPFEKEKFFWFVMVSTFKHMHIFMQTSNTIRC